MVTIEYPPEALEQAIQESMMPLITRENTKTVQGRLWAGTGALQTVTLLKRGDDQKQGTVTAYKLFDCRHQPITKTGETIQGDQSSDTRCVWHIPVIELERVGVPYLNALDRIVDDQGRYWQPEATTELLLKLMETHWCLTCLRIDPPATP